jgi:hypothetical protein
MKTKVLSIFAILMLIITASYAMEPLSVLQQTINSQIQFPANAIEKQIEGTVFVEFTVDDYGKIEVLNCSSLQGELQSYVFLKLSGMVITPDEELTGNKYLMRFDFKLE